MPADAALVAAVRAALADAGDPAVAPGQQAYMKSEMPYHGITAPRLKVVLRPFLRAYAPADRATHEATLLELWDGATHREERYAAVAFARHRLARPWLDPDALTLHRHLVVTGAWWDHVDEIASHLVGPCWPATAPPPPPYSGPGRRTPDLWVRRTSVLSQLDHKADTDTDLLRFAIEANVDDTSFWLRKAIGWSLREYAKTDPDWVRSRSRPPRPPAQRSQPPRSPEAPLSRHRWLRRPRGARSRLEPRSGIRARVDPPWLRCEGALAPEPRNPGTVGRAATDVGRACRGPCRGRW